MKRLCTITVLLFCLIIQAQTYRVYYEHIYRPNKVDTLKINELQVLILNKEKSSFQKYKTLKNDSLIVNNDYSEVDAKPEVGLYENPFIIKHRFSENKIEYSSILVDSYKYFQNIDYKWELSDENKIILNKPCQKAIVEFGGRKWIAWFSKDYPFSSGPYKFYGLPGIILKISDTSGDFSWEAKAIVQQKEDVLYDKNMFELQGMSSILLKKEEYKKIEKQYKEHPMDSMIQHLPDDFSSDELKNMQKAEQEMSKRLKYFNNSIELEEK